MAHYTHKGIKTGVTTINLFGCFQKLILQRSGFKGQMIYVVDGWKEEGRGLVNS